MGTAAVTNTSQNGSGQSLQRGLKSWLFLSQQGDSSKQAASLL